MMYTGDRLVKLLQQQHQTRHPGLFKQGKFTLKWRAKVGSFPHPDVETIVSGGEPCGKWKRDQSSGGEPCGSWKTDQTPGWRPENKRNVGENLNQLYSLPLNGYIPGSCIRGIVREWAKKRPEIKTRMQELLGYQTNENIYSGKIEFLDAWPEKPEPLTLDIVNPQQEFQVFHQGQSTPLSCYTLGDGEEPVSVTVAIRGTSNKVTPEEVNEVWSWVQQALTLYGVGSRTASGYGAIKSEDGIKPKPDPNYKTKLLTFTLYSQGCYGADPDEVVLRPSHWRGWLRSWMLRFLLGVMSEDNAKKTLGELMGVLEPEAQKGCVRLELVEGHTWGETSETFPYFYTWKGQLKLSAPTDILNKIILPILKFAAMTGGVGRGWRRPLHIFVMNNGREASRGSHLVLEHKVKLEGQVESKNVLLGIKPEFDQWQKVYQNWCDAVQAKWPNRFSTYQNPRAEAFSPRSCTVYRVPEPFEDPVDKANLDWSFTTPVENTRGSGMQLVYEPEYKREPELGGSAAGGGGANSHCSWVSIKRLNVRTPHTDCQEVVCLFMGGEMANSGHLRSQFLEDLAKTPGAVHLFGVHPHNKSP